MVNYLVEAKVHLIKGFCPLYSVGDKVVFKQFYIDTAESSNVCIHALSAMLTLLSPFLHGLNAKDLGIGNQDIGFVQCPDPGEPYTCGGTVIFELRRKQLGAKDK